jgi:2-iminobutanoate/2-iminopropanoate deaminase
MKFSALFAAGVALVLPLTAGAAETDRQHFSVAPPPGMVMPGGPTPPFSAAVLAGNTLYVSGTTDGGTAMGGGPAEAAKRVMDNVKRSVEAAGMTMDDLVWVQIFCSDLSAYGDFNDVYRTYFKGPMPARAFVGAGSLLGGARFEVMGVAVRKPK